MTVIIALVLLVAAVHHFRDVTLQSPPSPPAPVRNRLQLTGPASAATATETGPLDRDF